MSTNKIAFVTGTSSGIAADTALRLNNAGFTVYGGARRLHRIEDLKR